MEASQYRKLIQNANDFEAPEILMFVRSFPPAAGGTAFLLYDILRHFPTNALAVVHGPQMMKHAVATGNTLPFPTSATRVLGNALLSHKLSKLMPHQFIKLIVRQGHNYIRQYPIRRVHAHYPTAVFTVAAYKVARKYNLPLSIYFDILWGERGDHPELAQEYEHEIVQYADKRFAITEFAADYLTEKHGVEFEVIPHTIDRDTLTNQFSEVPADGAVRIHFAGGIYPQMNLDAVQRLANVIDQLDMDIQFDIYGPNSKEVLAQKGISSSSIRVGYVERSMLPAIQQASTVMFLPQAFDSAHPLMIRHNFPTKTLEYIAAGRPILLHSPEGSYLTQVARENEFAAIAAEATEEALADTLVELLENMELQRKLVANGFKFAATRDSAHWAGLLFERLMN